MEEYDKELPSLHDPCHGIARNFGPCELLNGKSTDLPPPRNCLSDFQQQCKEEYDKELEGSPLHDPCDGIAQSSGPYKLLNGNRTYGLPSPRDRLPDSQQLCENTPGLSTHKSKFAGSTERSVSGSDHRMEHEHCLNSRKVRRKLLDDFSDKKGESNLLRVSGKSRRYSCHLRTLEQFLDSENLTKEAEIPGTSTSPWVSNVSRMTTRLLLRRSIRSLYKLHSSGHCLRGSFSLANFLVDDNTSIYLDYEADSLKDYSKDGVKEDFRQFVRIGRNMFASEVIPPDIETWLQLIERDARGYEYLISYHSSLMEYHQTLSTFMSLYHKLQLMQRKDPTGYRFVLNHLRGFSGWTIRDLHNEFFDTFTRGGYDSDVMSW